MRIAQCWPGLSVGCAGIKPATLRRPFASAGHFPVEYARLSVAERMAGIRISDCTLAKKGLAFHSNERVNVVIGGRRSRRRTLRPGDRADPGLASVRGRIGSALRETEGSQMSFKLSDKQRELLSAAAEREDRLLAIPSQLKGAAAQKVAAKLVAASLAKEVKAKAGAPVWRRDAETDQAYALKLTTKGAKAIAADVEDKSE